MILYQGLLASPASWARVGRGYIGGLIELGVEVAAISPRGFLHDPSFQLPGGLVQLTPREARARPVPRVGIGFLHPTLLERLIGETRVNLFVWEADRVPPHWAQALLVGVDRVLVPSQFTREALSSSNFPAEKIRVVPYGFDGSRASAARIARETSTGPRPFTFLAVAAPHHRKGVREILLAYRRAFSQRDDVFLRFKTTYDPARSRRRRPFEIESWETLIHDCGLDEKSAPPLELTIEALPDDAMWRLYEKADVFVSPSRGESFGLALLEATASGLPAITTGWGGQLEFMKPGPDLLPFELEEAGDTLYEPARGARVAIPDIDALVARLRWHEQHRKESRLLGAKASEEVESLTWRNVTRTLLVNLQ